jgi:DNA replication protein DnaC
LKPFPKSLFLWQGVPVFTTQLPIDHWGEVIGDVIILDALIDRLEPPGIVIKMTGESYRKNMKKNKNVETSN